MKFQDISYKNYPLRIINTQTQIPADRHTHAREWNCFLFHEARIFRMTTNDHRFGVFEPCDSPIILFFLLSFATSLRARSIRAVANSLWPLTHNRTQHTHTPSLPLCTRYRSDRDSYPWLTERAWPYTARNKPGEAYYASVVNNNPRSAPCQTQPPLCMLRMFIVPGFNIIAAVAMPRPASLYRATGKLSSVSVGSSERG